MVIMVCFFRCFIEGGNLGLKVFIHFFVHSYVFRWVYMGQPYFQVSFNESWVYLGHFTLKVSFYQGTLPSVSSEWTAACLVPCVHQSHSRVSTCLVAHFPSLPYPVTLDPWWLSKPLDGTDSLPLSPLDDDRHSLWCRLFCDRGTQSSFCRTHSFQGMFFKNSAKGTHLGIVTYLNLSLERHNAKSKNGALLSLTWHFPNLWNHGSRWWMPPAYLGRLFSCSDFEDLEKITFLCLEP